jgi:hypothetical protein
MMADQPPVLAWTRKFETGDRLAAQRFGPLS